jgi:predicted O-methyltransferase YrrM
MPLEALSLDHSAVRGLMDLWSRIHWSSGDGMMPGDQLLTIYRLAANWPVDGDIVELGSWVGLTTSYLATACRVRGQGRVYAVDTFEGTKEGGGRYKSVARFGGGTFGAFRTQIGRAGVDAFVTPLVGYTDQVVDDYPGEPIRVLLIDADHSFEGVQRDFDCWLPWVAPGGLIIFHDYLMKGVARFVDGVIRDDPRVDAAPGHVCSNIVAVSKKALPASDAPQIDLEPDRSCEASLATA